MTDTPRFQPGQIVMEGGLYDSLGIILQSGPVTFDVVWIGGSTSRYRYATGRDVRLATEREIAELASDVRHLQAEAAAARDERRRGARIKRGQLWPSR